MTATARARTIGRWAAALAGIAAATYAAYVGVTWYRYGKTRRAPWDGEEPLDRFLPAHDVAERHQVRVRAPAEITYRVACSMDLQRSPIVRAIFKGRELLLGAAASDRVPRGLVDELKSLGWGVLEEVPDREIVLGSVTEPWMADVVFRAVAPEAFASLDEPGSVKIAVSMRVEPAEGGGSIFRTETRVATMDPAARARFRRYWSFLSPGILLIRWVMLSVVKKDAEREARAGR